MNMRTSEKTIGSIKLFEGFREKPYLCAGGYMTIGYGHIIRKSEDFSSIAYIDFEELLKQDIELAESAVVRLTKIMLHQYQFDALVSFVFNLGSAAYQRSTLRAKVNRSEHDVVPKEFTKWVYASGRIMNGLVKRRHFEAMLYRGY
jgi:lysozyme